MVLELRGRKRTKRQLSYWEAAAIYSAVGLVLGLIIGLLLIQLIDARLQRPAECSYSAQHEKPAERVKTAFTEVEQQAAEEAGPQMVSLGDFRITAYCPCAKCCGKTDGITATGTQATQGRTIAVDPDVIPYGTSVYIDGVEYIAEDCGGAIKGNRVDLYFNSHADALEYGVQTKELYIMEG